MKHTTYPIMTICFFAASQLQCTTKQEPPSAKSTTRTPMTVAEPKPEYTTVNQPTKVDPLAQTIDLQLEGDLANLCAHTRPRVYFPYDSAKLTSIGQTNLDKLASCIESKRLDKEELVVIGHADPRGSKRYNYQLGLDRARSVSELLADEGLRREQIEVLSMGESKASEDPKLWPQDRRVVVRLAQNHPTTR